MLKNKLFLSISVVVGYFAMVIVNFLANSLPIAGVTTGEVSDSYANLFAPAGATFAIWGIIYLLLLIYTVYQLMSQKKNVNAERKVLLDKINKYFLITSLINFVWIFAWHYGVIWLTVILILALLVCLIKIADLINIQKFSALDNLLIRAPFSIYFGWITVATIANITAFLVKATWNGFGIKEAYWTIIILLIGAAIGTWRTLKDKNIFYALVFVWAYFGIWLKHTSSSGFNGAYPQVISTVIICIIIFAVTISYLSYKKLLAKNILK